MSLTDLQIKRLKAPERGQRTYFDDALKGFGVRVSQGGAKTFVVLHGKDRKRRTIGRYPEISLSEARALAKRAQADMTLDDAIDAPRAPAISFTKARDRFLTDCEARNKPSTASEYRRLLQRHFAFSKELSELTRAEIMEVLEQLRGTPSEQRHAFVAIRTMLNWCRKRGLIDASPLPPMSVQAQPRSRVLTDAEVRLVWRRAETVGHPYGTIVQLLILTGQRRGEIAGLRRSWIDDGWIMFPQGFTKNKREHVVPLGPLAQEVIAGAPKDHDLLFPARGRDDVPFSGWSKSKRNFDKPLDVAGFTLHDLRRTYSSTMARLSTPLHVTEKLLNHVSGTISGVAAVYNRHSYRNEMREAVAAYESHLAAVLAE